MLQVKDQPLVSVVIASYNMGEYLPIAIRSVCEGSYKNIEVIIIDDGSTDNTQALIQPCLDDQRVRYIYQENLGQPKAKNNGVKVAKGEFIAFCDADDLWMPNKLSAEIPCFDLSPTIGVVSSEVAYIDENDDDIPSSDVPRHSGQITEQLVVYNCISFGSAVVKRECFDKLGLFDESLPMGIDWDLWLRFSLSYEFHHIDEITYLYRVWSGQMSNNNRGRYLNAKKILDKFTVNNPDAVPDSIINAAWADMYAREGRAIYCNEGLRWEALKSLVKALSYKPFSLLTWKGIGKVVLGLRSWSLDFDKYKVEILKRLVASRFLGSQAIRLTQDLPRVLMYHRFSDDVDSSCGLFGSVSESELRDQLDYITQNFAVIPLQKLVDEVLAKRVLPPRSLVITVDDGYSDFYDTAFPIFREYNLPVTLFVATDFVEGKKWLWPDIIRYILQRSKKNHVYIDLAGKLTLIRLGTDKLIASAWDILSNYGIELDDNGLENFLVQLSDICCVEVPAKVDEAYLPLNWSQISQMEAEGLDIGSHSITHRRMSTLSESEQREELLSSRRIIERNIAGRVKHFCYPYGRGLDYSNVSNTLLHECDYQSAVVGFHDNAVGDVMELRRYGIGDNHYEFLKKVNGLTHLKEKLNLLMPRRLER